MGSGDEILGNVERFNAQLLRQENGLVREVYRAYEQARADLLAQFTYRFSLLGDAPTAAQIRALAVDLELIRAIEERMAQLEGEFTEIARRGLAEVSQAGFEQAAQEVGLIARALNINTLSFAIDPLLEATIGPALGQIPGLVGAVKANVLSTLRERLAAGDRFTDIARAVFGKEQGYFRNGLTSAELMTRRSVIQANNNARLLYYEQAKQVVPGLQKQAVAALKSDTTATCLRVHGQIRDLDEPFVIEGQPSFGRRQQQPPFHWNCRTSLVAYHPIFEQTSSLKTADMVQAAQKKELATR